VPQV